MTPTIFEALPGDRIDQVATRICALATKFKNPVVVEFNGTMLIANPGDTTHQVLAQFDMKRDEVPRKQKLREMEQLSSLFYQGAVKIGVHAFIEFTGLMNEFIKVCRDMETAGNGAWDQANTHSDSPLKLKPHHVQYLAEKLDCIYGAALRANPALKKMMFGEDNSAALKLELEEIRTVLKHPGPSTEMLMMLAERGTARRIDTLLGNG